MTLMHTTIDSIFVAHLRLNLFTWKIFAPRFVFQVLAHCSGLLSTLMVIYLLRGKQ